MEYRLDSHTHTLASGHAYNTIMEMASAAAQKGLELLAITEHSVSMPGTCGLFYFHNLKIIPRELAGITVLFGAELNIMDKSGRTDMPDDLAARMDVTVASLHMPCIDPGTVNENTSAIIGAIENPLVNIIGHPDDGRYPVDFDTIAAAAKEHGTLLEVNNHSLEPGCTRENARENDIRMLEMCMKYRTPIILNSDAHWCGDIGNHAMSMALIEELGFPEELVVNRSVEEYKKFINRYKSLSLQ